MNWLMTGREQRRRAVHASASRVCALFIVQQVVMIRMCEGHSVNDSAGRECEQKP